MRFITERRVRGYATILVMGFLVFWVISAVLERARLIDTDFGTYYAAGRLAGEGHAALAYNHQALNDLRVHLGATGEDLWSYPPDLFLLTAPLDHLPPLWALGVWVSLSGALCLLLLRTIAPVRGLLLMAVSFWAPITSLSMGQGGSLSAAILGAGLLLIDSRPLVAGATLGALTYKPQLAMLIPVVLIATKRWRQFSAFCASAIFLAIFSALFFGFDASVAFIQHSGDATRILKAGGFNFDYTPTVTAAMLLFHAPFALALAVQALIAVPVVAGLILLWRSDVSMRLKAATLPAAILLCTFYAYYYDLMILAVSGAFLFAEAREAGWLRGEKWALFVMWMAVPVFLTVAHFSSIQIGPLFVAIPLVLVARRAIRSTRPTISAPAADLLAPAVGKPESVFEGQ